MALNYEYDHENASPYKNVDGQTVEPPKRLNYQFLLANKLPIYVLTAIPPQSVLTFTIKQNNGLPGSALRIPRSKVPFCVTSETSIETLRSGGRDIWSAIEKGMLVLVWPSDAENMLGTPTQAEEQTRTRLSRFSTLNAEKSPELLANERIRREAKIAAQNAEAEQEAEQEEPINARVLDITGRVMAGDVKLDKAIVEFENILDVMNERDFAYAITNAKGGKLREWLQTQLAKGAAPAPKKAKKEEKKKAKARDTGSVFDDNEPDMTDEEREAEARAEAEARQRQRING